MLKPCLHQDSVAMFKCIADSGRWDSRHDWLNVDLVYDADNIVAWHEFDTADLFARHLILNLILKEGNL